MTKAPHPIRGAAEENMDANSRIACCLVCPAAASSLAFASMWRRASRQGLLLHLPFADEYIILAQWIAPGGILISGSAAKLAQTLQQTAS